jgi:hypothetical protein
MISSPQFNDSHKMILKRVPTSPWKGFGFELQEIRITYVWYSKITKRSASTLTLNFNCGVIICLEFVGWLNDPKKIFKKITGSFFLKKIK